jgi:hypothetical protein
MTSTSNKTKIITIILSFISFTFIVGFPKHYENDLNLALSEKIPTTLSCRYTSYFFETITNTDIQCLTKEIATCGLYDDFNKPFEHEDGYLIFQPDDFFQSINLQDSDGNSVTVSGYAECLHYLNGGYAKSDTVSDESRVPRFNRIFLFLIIGSILYLTLENRRYLLSR